MTTDLTAAVREALAEANPWLVVGDDRGRRLLVLDLERGELARDLRL
ncbi:MAG: hypothetical protein QM765_10190 [Myxococcales bacterium]